MCLSQKVSPTQVTLAKMQHSGFPEWVRLQGARCPTKEEVFRQIVTNNKVSRDESERLLMETLS